MITVHSNLVRSGRLKHYPGIHVDAFNSEYREPCVVFTGHPCLRFGEVVHFMELWGSSPRNMVIFTEPEFSVLEAIAPFQTLQMKVSVCPIDTSLSYAHANNLLLDLNPRNVLIPEEYTRPPRYQPQRAELVIDCPSNTVTYKCGETVTLPIKRKFERIDLDESVTKGMFPNEVRPGVTVATVTGNLIAKDNRLKLDALTRVQLKELNDWSPGQQPPPPKHYLFGGLEPRVLVAKLEAAGFHNTTIDQTSSGCIVNIVSKSFG